MCNSARICIRRTNTTKNRHVANGAATTLAKHIGTSYEVNQRVRYWRKKESYEKRVTRSLCVMPLAYIYCKIIENCCTNIANKYLIEYIIKYFNVNNLI